LSLSIIDTTLQIEQLTDDFCQYFTSPLTVNGNFDLFQWSTGENSQTITVNSPGVYTVTASNAYCEKSSSFTISPCTLSLFIPNSFTPNGDGLNDYFAISSLNINVLEEFNILIYNRWGQIVFESFDPNFVWDGKCNYLKVLRSNTYSYVIKYRMKNEGSKHIRGSISVL
jgi:gliding motility-associated-like protein